MKKVVTIVGARPQFIKAATVSRAVAHHAGVSEVIVHTGQHYDANMSDIFFNDMAIPRPHYHLGVGGGQHGAMTGRQLEKIEEVLMKEAPDWALVYGDTNSTLAGALAAVKLHIPVAHIEAGLRSFNRRMPEEINRILTDHASTLLFAPTSTARDNLLAEGIPDDRIHVVGDVMYDAALFYKDLARKPEWFDDYDLAEGEFVLCTLHRAENTEEPLRMRSILHGLAQSDAPIIMPLHPRTRKRIHDFGLQTGDNIFVVEPVGYLEMTWLETHCRLVATDSRGVEKEAYFSGKPCVTLRDETEWVELVTSGANVLTGADAALITKYIQRNPSRLPAQPLYGAGDAAMKIISILA
jgi:UDP-GlcNAc3NAcA epimerase